MQNLGFSEKGLEIVSPPRFVYDLSRKMFLMFYSINSLNLIFWLPLLFVILGIAIICFPGCDFINFEINLIFLIKPSFYMTKKARQKLKYLEKKAFSIIFKGL